jgi:hypothetical protein
MTDRAGAPPLGWAETLSGRFGLSPPATAALVAALAFGVCALGNNADGSWDGLRMGGVLFYEHPFGRMSLTVSVLIGYLCVWPPHVVRGAVADFGAISWGLENGSRAEALRSALETLDPPSLLRSRLWGLVGLPAVPVIMAATSQPGFAIFFPRYIQFNTVWSLAATGLLFWLIGRAAYLCARHVRTFQMLAEELRKPDPLAPEPILAFGRSATRAALGWIGTLSITAFMLSNPSFVLPLVPLMIVTLGAAAYCFFGIVLAVRRRIQRTRTAELVRVRSAALEERAVLYEGVPSARLAALLAWEDHVREWSSWPFETPVALRGALLVLLPLGSWLGGALVERLVEWGLAQA